MSPAGQRDTGRLGENILMFCRTLRAAGIPAGPAQVLDALRAVAIVGVRRRDEFCWALRAVLVRDPGQFRLFEQAFHMYFRNPRLLERMIALLLPTIERPAGEGEATIRRLSEALSEKQAEAAEEGVAIEVDRAGSYSPSEILRHKDFEQMSLAEQREARQILRQEIRPLRRLPTRRYRTHPGGRRFDLRRSMQLMIRNDGQLIRLARKRRIERPPALVVICDISGSMSRYSRMFLHFAHVLAAREQSVHSFVFGTRLTNITRRLAERDVDEALRHVSTEVQDWDGGTRIGASIRRFNHDWARRVLAQNAVVVLLSDGLERDTGSDLEFQMERLRRSCRQLIWLNPMLRYTDFAPRAFGIRKMLPHVDLFLPAHNVDSLAGLVRILNEQHRFISEASQVTAA
ncbi:MAG: VWA domain-containing protein [Gammaproteobacteria bacterium]|nr:VWA domain-containing protein [Gammaproteobacteria bacterium]MDH4253032.1 VWA domain-containing protein [Gammaproteobacteria bacterium]MDH5308546.1 VWA domain-containing protein [Gammaproteobacteria bacterium]